MQAQTPTQQIVVITDNLASVYVDFFANVEKESATKVDWAETNTLSSYDEAICYLRDGYGNLHSVVEIDNNVVEICPIETSSQSAEQWVKDHLPMPRPFTNNRRDTMTRFDIPTKIANILKKAVELDLIDALEIYSIATKYNNNWEGMVNEIIHISYADHHSVEGRAKHSELMLIIEQYWQA